MLITHAGTSGTPYTTKTPRSNVYSQSVAHGTDEQQLRASTVESRYDEEVDGVNPRKKRILQISLAIALYVLTVLALVSAFVPIHYPDWLPKVNVELPSISWWPQVQGIDWGAHYSARIFLALAIGLTIFIPQVETTFVSLLRQRSPIGARYVDRRHFACPNCGTVNRPSVLFCVRCGTAVGGGTRHWGPGAVRGQGALVSVAKFFLFFAFIFAFFVGIFDLSLYTYLVEYLGTTSEMALLATLISSLPCVAGYAALKEGFLRRYSSLRQFDRLVFGNSVWLLFGLLFLLLSAMTFLGPPPTLFGIVVVAWIQLLLGLLMILHPLIRRRLAASATLAYP